MDTLITLRVSIALQLLKAKKVLKGAEVVEMLAKNFNKLFFPQQPLPKLPETMLWKYFKSCMYSFTENWEINLKILHTVPSFNP